MSGISQKTFQSRL